MVLFSQETYPLVLVGFFLPPPCDCTLAKIFKNQSSVQYLRLAEVDGPEESHGTALLLYRCVNWPREAERPAVEAAGQGKQWD